MSELKKAANEINRRIDNVAGLAEVGIDILFSPIEEGAVQKAEERMRKCKKVCRVIGIIVLVGCVATIYFHLKG